MTAIFSPEGFDKILKAVAWNITQQRLRADCHREEGRPTVLDTYASSVRRCALWAAEFQPSVVPPALAPSVDP